MKKKILVGIQVGCVLTMYGLCGTMDIQEHLPMFPFLIYVALTFLIMWLAFEASKPPEVKIVYVSDEPPVPEQQSYEWKDINPYVRKAK